MPKVVVTQPVHPEVAEFLRTFCAPDINPGTWSDAERCDRARDADGLMVFMTDRMDEAFLAACPRLRVIAGALKGHDNFDLAACQRRGVWFTIVPDLLTEPTAELALALLLGVLRRVVEGDALIRSGAFTGWRPALYGRSLDGATVGIVGFGAVGRAFARRLAGFDVRILYTDRKPVPPEVEQSLRATRVAWDALLAESDVLAPFVHLTPATLHLFDAATLARLKPGAVLVNCARGSIVDEAAVADALVRGQLGGYAADVFELEDLARPDRPTRIPPALLADPRTLFTPHLGSAVGDVRRRIELHAAEQLRQALAGQRPATNAY